MLESLQKTCPPTNGKMDSTRSQSAGNTVSWLAGFTDGEGCIGFNKISGKKDYHVPHVTLTNCHKPTIERIVNILSSLGVRFWVVSREPRKSNWKSDSVIVIRGIRRTKIFLEAVAPLLFTKKEQADAVLEFINHRLSLSPKAPYGEKEKELIERLHALNHRGSSETTRVPHDSEKI